MATKVSVIVPIYNMEVFLPQCFYSIAEQSYRELEIILVDDGSSDGSAAMCDAFAEADERVVVIHKPNGGLTSARKAGLNAVSGEYVLFADSDDWMDPDLVLHLVRAAQRDNADCVLCSYIKEFKHGSAENYLFSEDFSYEAEDSEKRIHQSLIGPDAEGMRHPERIDNLSTTWGKLYTRETALRGFLVNEREVGYTEDTLFNIYALDGCERISYVHKCLYHYRKYNAKSLTAGYRTMLAEKYNVHYNYIENYVSQAGKAHYRQLLMNRIACGMITLGINEVNAPVGFAKKAEAIRALLNRPRYMEAIKVLQTQYCPLPWKVFFFLCRHRQTYALTSLLLVIEFLRNRKNKAASETGENK